MHKISPDSPGQETIPSLLAPRDAVCDSSVDATGQGEGILTVVSHGHAGSRSQRTWRRRVAPVVALVLVSVLAWWVWPLGADSTPAREEVSLAQGRPPQHAPTGPVPSLQDDRTPASAAPTSSAARIELAEEEPATHSPPVEVQAAGPVAGMPSSAAQSPVSGAKREVLRAGRPPSEPVRRPVARTADPDVEVIEVLMSRAAPEPTIPRQASAGQRPVVAASNRDVVLVQAGVPTAELVQRCLTLGWLEGQLCRARVCATRHDDETACPRQATALGSP
ncbi:hypothetical protein [Caldimonas sp.]|uniref:hypothetical protein n=1 Tax=Caldimonas sp. TaxID=2838790 RepID=UPI00391DBD67